MDLVKIENRLKSNKHVAKLLHSFKTKEDLQLNLDVIETELNNLFRGRPIKTLTSRNVSPASVIKANLADQRARSRIVELWSQMARVEYELSQQLSMVKELLFLAYKNTFSEYKSRADKERLLNVTVFNELETYLGRIASLKEIAGYMLADIDQAGWTLRRHVDLLVNTSQRMNSERQLT